MAEPRPLSVVFQQYKVSEVPGSLGSLQRLETELQSMLTQGRAAWPGLALQPETFAQYLASRLRPGEDCGEGLRDLRPADLYLACAYLHRVPRAAEAFEEAILVPVRRMIAFVRNPEAVEDAIQTLQMRLLFPDEDHPDEPAKLLQYTGRKPLLGFVRKSAVGVVLDSLRHWDWRRRGGGSVADDALGTRLDRAKELRNEALTASTLTVIGRFGPAFKAAYDEAFSALTSEERNFLRLRKLELQPQWKLAAAKKRSVAAISRKEAMIEGHLKSEIWQRLRTRAPQMKEEEFRLLLADLLHGDLLTSLREILKQSVPTEDEIADERERAPEKW